MYLRVSTNDYQRHVIHERTGGGEVLNRAQHREQQSIGRVGLGAAQLRLDARIAELLVRIVNRLEDTVGISQQHVARAQFDAATNIRSICSDAEQQSTVRKQFQIAVRA